MKRETSAAASIKDPLMEIPTDALFNSIEFEQLESHAHGYHYAICSCLPLFTLFNRPDPNHRNEDLIDFINNMKNRKDLFSLANFLKNYQNNENPEPKYNADHYKTNDDDAGDTSTDSLIKNSAADFIDHFAHYVLTHAGMEKDEQELITFMY